nr:CPBP family intramembrane glutamic endopeptidase [uncultured Desulfobacter sp.]
MKTEKSPIGTRQSFLWIELFAFFFITPFILIPFRQFLAFKIVPILILLGIGIYVYLKNQTDFQNSNLIRFTNMGTHAKGMLLIIGFGVPVLIAFTRQMIPGHLFSFPATHPKMWTIVMVAYPVLAALPQELIFRCFFFHRYGKILVHPKAMILANGISFGMFHMFYGNPVAPLLSMAAGFLFAWRYHRSQSLPIVAIEHGIWGNLIFTIGTGWYFYSGAIQ